MAFRRLSQFVLISGALGLVPPAMAQPVMPRLHHVGLNTVDAERAIAWYLKVWPSATRTTVAGFPALRGDMLVLFNTFDHAPPGAWRDDLHRAEPQSAFWHIGAFVNTADINKRLNAVGVVHRPLFISATESPG